MTGPGWLDAAAIAAALPMTDAIAALADALADGVDPGADPPRTAVEAAAGQALLMPSVTADALGVKVVTIAAGNPDRGLPRVQAVYILCDAATLTPIAVLDGTALTALRTPAVSALAARSLAVPDAARLVVFGAGPQAAGHVTALRAVRPIERVTVVGRRSQPARRLVERLTASGLAAAVGTADAVADAEVIVCATTAREPLFAADLVGDTACVIAVGSHEPTWRELSGALLARSSVVVEHAGTALREAGDIVLAVEEGRLHAGALVELADLVTGDVAVDPDRPRVFKSVGMAWEDLVVAAAVYRRVLSPGGGSGSVA